MFGLLVQTTPAAALWGGRTLSRKSMSKLALIYCFALIFVSSVSLAPCSGRSARLSNAGATMHADLRWPPLFSMLGLLQLRRMQVRSTGKPEVPVIAFACLFQPQLRLG